jgi:CHASE2 domain-containing sensor protein
MPATFWADDVETRVTLGAEHLVNARFSRRDPVRVNAFAWFSGMMFATWGLVSGTILAAVNPGAGMALVGLSALGISLASMKIVRLPIPGGMERRPPRTLGPKSPADE